MTLQKTLMASTVAATFLAGAGQALAWIPTWDPVLGVTKGGVDIPEGQQIWHSGASASTGTVQGAVCDKLCDGTHADGVDVFNGSEFWFISCHTKADTSVPVALRDKDILYSKRDFGGSGVGVGPVKLGTTIGFMKPSTGAGTNFPTPLVDTGGACGAIAAADPKLRTYTETGFDIPSTTSEADPTADAVSRTPNLGTSDIEPDKFTSAFTENVTTSDLDLDGVSGPALAAHDATGLTVAGLGILTFNTPVNLRMYLDLQAVQFPTGHPLEARCNPKGADYGKTPLGLTLVVPTWDSGIPGVGMPTAGSLLDPRTNANSNDCMPSLTGMEIRSMFMTGRDIASSTDFQAESAYGAGDLELVGPGSVDSVSTVALRSSTDNTIQLCRRVEGSGTQAQFNAMHIGYPCDPTGDATIDTLRPQGFVSAVLTPFVTESESSTGVELCLDAYNDGVPKTSGTTTVDPGGKKRWAIGVQSAEKNAPTATSFPRLYRFIKIDTAAPCVQNVHAGDYWNWARQTIQYLTAGATAETIAAHTVMSAALSGATELGILNKPASFCQAQDGFSTATKTVGWLAVGTPTDEVSFTAPLARFRRVSSTGVNNTCALPSAIPSTAQVTIGPNSHCVEGSDLTAAGDQNCYTP